MRMVLMVRMFRCVTLGIISQYWGLRISTSRVEGENICKCLGRECLMVAMNRSAWEWPCQIVPSTSGKKPSRLYHNTQLFDLRQIHHFIDAPKSEGILSSLLLFDILRQGKIWGSIHAWNFLMYPCRSMFSLTNIYYKRTKTLTLINGHMVFKCGFGWIIGRLWVLNQSRILFGQTFSTAHWF